MSDRAAEIVSGISELPPVPHVALRMNQLLHDRRATARDVSQLLASDPSVASNVLSLANSAFYGANQRVGTLTHAVLVLGFNTVRNVVSASSLMRALSSYSRVPDEEHFQFWRHSLACGTLSKLLAVRIGLADCEELFLMGLLHDVGEIVLRGWCSESAAAIEARTDDGQSRNEAELEVLGTTHALVGGALMERWQLPAGHVDVVRNHHTPSLARESELHAAIVHVADALVYALGHGITLQAIAPRLDREAWAAVGIEPEHLTDLFRATLAGVEQIESFLKPAWRGSPVGCE
ncbi:MAG: HDOD domain-containing protein [Planctomycetes bacterium]|nr:HDOD domain-containing protein [Planctomycetota bacterium]